MQYAPLVPLTIPHEKSNLPLQPPQQPPAIGRRQSLAHTLYGARSYPPICIGISNDLFSYTPITWSAMRAASDSCGKIVTQ
jgi:hypothetical protein